jgi:hypothetical protein
MVIGLASIKITLFTIQNGSFLDSFFLTFNYSLADSFILNYSSPIYIYNNLNRFDPSIYQRNNRVDLIFTGDNYFYVEAYNSVKINITTPTGKELFKLKNVAYIPDFYINIIFYKKLR